MSKNTKGKVQLTEGSISSGLAHMALPLAGGILANMTFNIVDTYFVSGLGEEALAALSFTFPVVMVVISLSIGLGAGTSSVVAIAAGKKDDQTVKELITDGLTLTLVLTLILSVIGFFTIDLVFRWLGAGDHVLPLIFDYMSWWYLGAIFMTVPMVSLAALRALGDSRMQGSLMLAMAVANAILDPILIYGWWIFPRLEIEGAAIASVIVRVAAVAVLFHLLHNRMRLLVNPFAWTRMKTSWKAILHVGLPAMGTNMIIPVSGTVILAIVAQHGVEVVAGYGAAVRIEAMALIFFYALSAVMGPFCGQNLGAGNFDRLFDVQRIMARFCTVVGFVMAAALWLASEPLARIFSQDPLVIDTVGRYLLLVPMSYFAYGIVMSVNASFNGLRKPLPGMVISICRVIVVLWPVAFVGNYFWGLDGIFVAIAASNIGVGIMAYWWIQATLQKTQNQMRMTAAVE